MWKFGCKIPLSLAKDAEEEVEIFFILINALKREIAKNQIYALSKEILNRN